MKIQLNPVRLYTDTDIYETDVDNRPLADLNFNTDLLNEHIGKLGFYMELSAGPDEEPAGGFSENTCGYIGSNSLLYPINISKPSSLIDYSKHPIVLIIGKNATNSKYKCLAFSALYSISDRFQSFLPSSIGNMLKVGPGGQLIDEFFFEQYHSGKSYQNLVVGKIVSVKEIAFGGNQINIFGDNQFILKNHNDSTNGLVTIVRDNKDSNVIFKSVGLDTVNSPYVFSEIQCSFKSLLTSTLSNPSPVFFTNESLTYNQLTGDILDQNINVKLNEVHFKSPEITISGNQPELYKSLGATVGSILSYSSNNLLHSYQYSSNSSEITQNIGTSLIFKPYSSLQGSLVASFPSIVKDIGAMVIQSTGMPDSILPNTGEFVNGIELGDYTAGFGSLIQSVVDGNTSNSRLTAQEELNLQVARGFTTTKLSSQTNGQTLLLHSKSTDTQKSSNISMYADGYVVLSGKNGVHVSKYPEVDSELVNKGYLNFTLSQIANVSDKIPLTGTSIYNPLTQSFEVHPVTGTLHMDLTNNTENQTTVFNFTSAIFTEISSNNIVKFSTSPGNQLLQRLMFSTDPTLTSTDWNGSEGVNKAFLESYITSLIGIPNGSNVVSTNTPQSILAQKTFTQPIICESGIQLSGSNPYIHSSTDSISLGNTKLLYSPTISASDSDSILVTKGYIESTKDSILGLVKPIWATWNVSNSLLGGLIGNQAPDTKSPFWVGVGGPFPVVETGGSSMGILAHSLVSICLNCSFHLTEYVIKVSLVKNSGGVDTIVATGAAGSSTTAAGLSTGFFPLTLNAQVECQPYDTLRFVVEEYQTKSLGTKIDVSTYGFASISVLS